MLPTYRTAIEFISLFALVKVILVVMKQLSISYTHACLVYQGRDVKIKRAMWYMYVEMGRKEGKELEGKGRKERKEEQKARREGRGERMKEGRKGQAV